MRLRLGLVVLGCALAATPARAEDRPDLAIVPFSGLHADEPQSVVVRMLKGRAQLVPAGELGRSAAAVVITGTVEHPDGKLRVVVSALSARSGDVVGQLVYPIPKGRHLTKEQLKELATKVNELANRALATVKGEAAPAPAPAPTDEEAERAAEAAVAQATDTESAPLDINDLRGAELRAQPLPRRYRAPRPVWAPFVEAELGVVVAGRSVSFKPSLFPNFQAGSGGGLHLDLTLYPFAPFWDRWKGVLSGLGGGVTIDKPLWPTTQANGNFVGAGGSYPTSELRVEGGLRWRFVVRRALPRLELTALAGAGLHSFFVSRTWDPVAGAYVDVGPPNVRYVFGSFGAAARLHVREWADGWVAFSYEYVPDGGHVEDVAEYGYASMWGLHLRGGLDFVVWRRLRVGAAAYWERFALSFTHAAPLPYKSAASSVDNFYGGLITVGYAF